jgi:hypothetical protein
VVNLDVGRFPMGSIASGLHWTIFDWQLFTWEIFIQRYFAAALIVRYTFHIFRQFVVWKRK